MAANIIAATIGASKYASEWSSSTVGGCSVRVSRGGGGTQFILLLTFVD